MIVYATGLGLPLIRQRRGSLITTGVKYPPGGPITSPPNTTDTSLSSLAGGKTADVLSADAHAGNRRNVQGDAAPECGYTDGSRNQVTIAQNVYVSNVVTIPVVNPNPQ